MTGDIAEESWVYQEILQEGVEKGIESQRAALIGIVQVRFPSLTELAQKRACKVNDLDALRDMLVQVGIAKDEQEAHAALLNVKVVQA